MIVDYFSAPDDDTARQALDGRTPHQDDTFGIKIDPVVALAELVADLTDSGYEEVSERFKSCTPPPLEAHTEDEECHVIGVPDTAVEALATATTGALRAVGASWAASDEQWPYDDGDRLPEALVEFAAFVQRARAAGQRLYCYWAL
jgi:hypothetical protein